MRTLVIRLDREREPGDYTAELLVEDKVSDLRRLQSVTRDVIPADLPELRALLNGRSYDHSYGLDLYKLLLGTSVGRDWRAAAEGTSRTFFDIGPDVLRALRWELLTDELGRYLFAADSTCLRGRFHERGPRTPDVPIKVLVLVGAPQPGPAEPDPLCTEDEVDAIWEALSPYPGEWHVEVVRGPDEATFAELYRELSPDVFHFIGHTGPPGAEGRALEVRLPKRVWDLDARWFANMTHPSLIVLNACRTSEGGAVEARSVAATVAGLRTSALVTMQDDITSAAAVPFTRSLYRWLAAGETIDRAVSRARWALAFQHPDAGPLEWALPSLTVNGDPAGVLPPRPSANAPEAFGNVRLADRTADLRRLWGPESPIRLTPRVTLIEDTDRVRAKSRTESERRVGKTKLVTACLHSWHLQGEQVCYADMAGTGNLTWLDALRRIRDALRHCLPQRSAEPIRRFDHCLTALKEGRKPEPLPPACGETDDGGDWRPEHEHELEARRRMFTEARTMLSGVAGDRPLVLALDHISRVLREDRHDYLVPGLLAPIARGELPQVALIIADRGEHLDPLRELLPLGTRRIRVDDFPITAGLLRQCGVHFRAELADDVRQEFSVAWLRAIPHMTDLFSRLSADVVDNMLGAAAVRG